MRGPGERLSDALGGLLRARPWALVCRVVVLLGPQVALWATATAGPAPRMSLVALTLLLSGIQVALPESHAGAFALAVPMAWWGIALRDGVHPGVMLAGAGLVAAHVAGVLLASGPGSVRLGREVIGRWCVRGVLVWLIVPSAWAATLVLGRVPRWDPAWGIGAAALVVAVAVAWVASGAGDPEDTPT